MKIPVVSPKGGQAYAQVVCQLRHPGPGFGHQPWVCLGQVAPWKRLQGCVGYMRMGGGVSVLEFVYTAASIPLLTSLVRSLGRSAHHGAIRVCAGARDQAPHNTSAACNEGLLLVAYMCQMYVRTRWQTHLPGRGAGTGCMAAAWAWSAQT